MMFPGDYIVKISPKKRNFHNVKIFRNKKARRNRRAFYKINLIQIIFYCIKIAGTGFHGDHAYSNLLGLPENFHAKKADPRRDPPLF